MLMIPTPLASPRAEDKLVLLLNKQIKQKLQLSSSLSAGLGTFINVREKILLNYCAT
jgi:hypothetical protein